MKAGIIVFDANNDVITLYDGDYHTTENIKGAYVFDDIEHAKSALCDWCDLIFVNVVLKEVTTITFYS